MVNDKLLITINNIEDIKEYKKIGITNFLFALQDFSIGYSSFKIQELKKLDVNVYLNINIVMDTKTINNFKKITKDLNFVKGILFEDVGVYYLLKDSNIDLIWNQSHFVINSKTINSWLSRVKSALISSELTIDELNYVLEQASKPLILSIYGLNMSMYSKRHLLSFYNIYNDLPNINKGSLSVEDKDINFITKENEHGTVLFYNKPYNYIPYLKEIKEDRIMLYLINIPDLSPEMLDHILKQNNIISEEKFLKEKTIFKLEV